jgi:serine/threonine protein kinase
MFASRFELRAELGSGGQATVYRAYDRRLRREVALKVFTNLSEEAAARIVRRAERLRELDDPRLCPILDAGRKAGVAFLAMPVIEGRTLAQDIAERRGRTDSRVELGRGLSGRLAFVEQLARAVHELHERGIVHRDLKPANVMIGPDGAPVILDLGLAVAEAPDLDDETFRQSFAGSAAYMAPERVTDRDTVDRRTDVFSLGAVLFEVATCKRLFEGATSAQVFAAIHTARGRRLRAYVPTASASLEALVVRSVAPNPSRRPESALVFADDLAAIRCGRTIKPGPALLPARIARALARRPRLSLLGAAALSTALLGSALIGLSLARRDLIDDGDRILSAERRSKHLADAYLNLSEGAASRAREALEALLDRETAPDGEMIAASAFFELVAGKPEAVRDLLAAHPDVVDEHPELEFLRANSLRLESRYDEATALDATVPPSTTATGHFIRGVRSALKSHGGDLAAARSAVAHLRHAIALESPARALHLAELVHAATHAGDDEVADRASTALINRWPGRFSTWFWRGFSLQVRDPLASLSAYQRALDLDPNADICRLAMSGCLERLQDHDAARRLVLEVIARDPKLPQAHHRLAEIHLAAGRLRDAHTAVIDHLALEPRSVAGMSLLADVLHRLERPLESADVVRRLLEVGGGRTPSVMRYLAHIDLMTGFYEEALSFHTLARASSDHATPDALGQARALLSLGRPEAATAMIESALAEESLGAADRRRLGDAREAAGDEAARLLSAPPPPGTTFGDRLRWVAARLEVGNVAAARRLLETRFDDDAVDARTSLELARLATLLASCAEGPETAQAARARGLLRRLLERWKADIGGAPPRDLGSRLWQLRSWSKDPWLTLRRASTGPLASPGTRRASDELWAQIAACRRATLSRWLAQDFPSPDG